MHDAVERRGPRARLARLIDEIGLYAAFHFLGEENLVLDTGYPNYADHRTEHLRWIALLSDRAHRFATNEDQDGSGALLHLGLQRRREVGIGDSGVRIHHIDL